MPSRQPKRRPMTTARRLRIFEAHGGICGYCKRPIDGDYVIDHVVPLAHGGADDDGGNAVPMHPACHQIKIPGRRRGQDEDDSRRTAKMRRLGNSRGDGPPRPRQSLSHPHLVRSPDGSVYVRDGTERKMR